MAAVATVGMFETFRGLYDNKLRGTNAVLSEAQKDAIARVQNSKLLRLFVEPGIELKMPEGYVPPQLELELVYYVVRGNYPQKGASYSSLLEFALDRFNMLGGYRATYEG